MPISGSSYPRIQRLEDSLGFVAQLGPMRDLDVAQPYRVVGAIFGSALDSVFWTASTSGAGSSAAASAAVATVASGTANNGYGQIVSSRSARFLCAHPLVFRGAFRVPTLAVALNTRRWGLFSVSTITPQNGAYFEISAAGVLSVNIVSGASVTSVSSGSFNGHLGASYTLDTNVHAYEIIAFTMGVWFCVDGVLLHRILPTTSVLYQSLDVPIAFTSVNGAAGTTSGTLECWNASTMRLGRDITMPTHAYQDATTAARVLKTGPGALHSILMGDVANLSVVTLYDNTAASGTVIFNSGTMTAQTQPYQLDLHTVPFYIGLTLVIATTASKVTVIYE